MRQQLQGVPRSEVWGRIAIIKGSTREQAKKPCKRTAIRGGQLWGSCHTDRKAGHHSPIKCDFPLLISAPLRQDTGASVQASGGHDRKKGGDGEETEQAMQLHFHQSEFRVRCKPGRRRKCRLMRIEDQMKLDFSIAEDEVILICRSAQKSLRICTTYQPGVGERKFDRATLKMDGRKTR